MMRGSGVERLGDGKRPVPEERFGREELQVDQVTGERSQREECLETRNATAGDQNPKASVRAWLPSIRHFRFSFVLDVRTAIRSSPLSGQ